MFLSAFSNICKKIPFSSVLFKKSMLSYKPNTEETIMIYVTSDLHGYPLDKFKAFLDKSGFGGRDYLFVLGDVIDRGTDGIKILEWLMVQPNAELILGNHEAMMLSCEFLFDEINEKSISELTGTDLQLYSAWIENSGQPTLDALSAMREEEIEYILEYLRDAPLYEAISVGDRDFILTHSGLGNFDPKMSLSKYSSFDLLWTRPELDQKYFDDITVIFGHTPTYFYGEEYTGRAVFTDSWINIDTGSGHGYGPMLLRLDDMKTFYADENK